jgi:hypothetical protein
MIIRDSPRIFERGQRARRPHQGQFATQAVGAECHA